jgi:hypothetical protein
MKHLENAHTHTFVYIPEEKIVGYSSVDGQKLLKRISKIEMGVWN